MVTLINAGAFHYKKKTTSGWEGEVVPWGPLKCGETQHCRLNQSALPDILRLSSIFCISIKC